MGKNWFVWCSDVSQTIVMLWDMTLVIYNSNIFVVETSRKYEQQQYFTGSTHYTKKWSFPLVISSINMNKSAGNCGSGHIYWINSSWKTSFFVQWHKLFIQWLLWMCINEYILKSIKWKVLSRSQHICIHVCKKLTLALHCRQSKYSL